MRALPQQETTRSATSAPNSSGRQRGGLRGTAAIINQPPYSRAQHGHVRRPVRVEPCHTRTSGACATLDVVKVTAKVGTWATLGVVK
eukprot:1181094-Prorocentrum_minimum.AAC.4